MLQAEKLKYGREMILWLGGPEELQVGLIYQVGCCCSSYACLVLSRRLKTVKVKGQ